MDTFYRTTVLVVGANVKEAISLKETFYPSELNDIYVECDIRQLNQFICNQENRDFLINEPVIILLNGECSNIEYVLNWLRENKKTKHIPIIVYGEVNSCLMSSAFERMGADHYYLKSHDDWTFVIKTICKVWIKAQIAYSC